MPEKDDRADEHRVEKPDRADGDRRPDEPVRRPARVRVVPELEIRDHHGDDVDDREDDGKRRVGDDPPVPAEEDREGVRNQGDDERDLELVRRRRRRFDGPGCAGLDRWTFHDANLASRVARVGSVG